MQIGLPVAYRWFIRGGAWLGIAVAVVSCSREPRTAESSAAVTLRIGTALPAENNRADVGLRGLAELLYTDSLIAVGWDGKPEGRLAESWLPLESEAGYRIRIRPGVRFHDGRPVTATVVRDHLKVQIPLRAYPGSENIASVEADGDDLVLKLRQPDAFVVPDLNLYPIVDPQNAFNGTGPFRITSRNPWRLQKNASYYRGQPTIDLVELGTYPTQRKAWAALMRGDIDFLHQVSRDAVDFMQAESMVRTYSSLWPFYVAMVFNVERPHLRSPEVRTALNEAINRDEVIRKGMRGHGQTADGPIWPYHWAYTIAPRTYTYNPVAARLRLNKPASPAGRLSLPGAGRLHFTCLYYGEDPRYERIALVLQRQLFDVGVDVEMQPVSLRELMVRLNKGDFDAFLFELTSGRSLSWVYRFWHSPEPGAQAFIRSGYTSADRVLERMRRASSEDETRAAVVDLQRVLFEDPPAMFLAWPESARAVDSRFNVPTEPGKDILGSIWQWAAASAAQRASR